MIEQQYYSRGSYGLTLHSGGHDTIAASAGLTEQQLCNLNTFCEYYDGAPMTTKGEQIPIVSRRILPDGRILFSKRVPREYVDAGGIRKTFFMHNYIIPADSPEEEDSIEDVRKISDPGVFVTDYREGTDSSRLPSLQVLPLTAQYDRYNALRVLLQSGTVSEDFFLQILYGVLHSIDVANKPVIIFNDMFDSENFGALLVQAICCFLPYSMRKRFSFTTMQCSRFLESNYTLLMVHQEELERARSSQTLRQSSIADFYVFDRQGQCSVFNPVQLNDDPNSFFAYAARNVHDPAEMDKLFVYFKEIENALHLQTPKLTDYDRLLQYYPGVSSSYSAAYYVLMYYRNKSNSVFTDLKLHDAVQTILNDPQLPVKEEDFREWIYLCTDTDESNFGYWIELIKKAIHNTLLQGNKSGVLAMLDICWDAPRISPIIRSWALYEEADLVRLTYSNKINNCNSIEDLLQQYGSVCSEGDQVLSVVRPVVLDRMETLFSRLFVSGDHQNDVMASTVAAIKAIQMKYSEFPQKECGILEEQIIRLAQDIVAYVRKCEPKLTIETHRHLVNIGHLLQVHALVPSLSVEIKERTEKSTRILEAVHDASVLELSPDWLLQRTDDFAEELNFYYTDICREFTQNDYPGLLYIGYNPANQILYLSEVLLFLYEKEGADAVIAFLDWLCDKRGYPLQTNYLYGVSLDKIEMSADGQRKPKIQLLNSILRAAGKIGKRCGISPKECKAFAAGLAGVLTKPLNLGTSKNDYRDRLQNALSGMKVNYISTKTKGELPSADSTFEQRKSNRGRKQYFRLSVPVLIVTACVIIAGILASVLPYSLRTLSAQKLYQERYASTVTSAQEEILSLANISFAAVADYLSDQQVVKNNSDPDKVEAATTKPNTVSQSEVSREDTSEQSIEASTSVAENFTLPNENYGIQSYESTWMNNSDLGWSSEQKAESGANVMLLAFSNNAPVIERVTVVIDYNEDDTADMSTEPDTKQNGTIPETEEMTDHSEIVKEWTDALETLKTSEDTDQTQVKIDSFQDWEDIRVLLDKKGKIERISMRYDGNIFVTMNASRTLVFAKKGNITAYFILQGTQQSFIAAKQELVPSEENEKKPKTPIIRWFDENSNPLFIAYHVRGLWGKQYKYSTAQDDVRSLSRSKLKKHIQNSRLETYYDIKTNEIGDVA